MRMLDNVKFKLEGLCHVNILRQGSLQITFLLLGGEGLSSLLSPLLSPLLSFSPLSSPLS